MELKNNMWNNIFKKIHLGPNIN